MLWAARLHSARFHRNLLKSLLVMVNAERRVVDRQGGVATVTVLGRTGRWAAAFVIPYLAGLAAIKIAPPRLSQLALLAGLLAVIAGLYFAPAFERQVRARVTFDVHDRPWLVGDVATVPHRRIGDRLIATLTTNADNAGARMVLRVDLDNHTAIRLYERHGFVRVGERRSSLLMHRLPRDPNRLPANAAA